MDVTSSNIWRELVPIMQHIADSQFVGFDFEFSGVAPRRSGAGKMSLQEYYSDIREAAQTYQILQVGMTTMAEDADKGHYVVRPYNLNLCPLPDLGEQTFRRTWSYNSGAVRFLMRNGFSFDLPLNQGVPYLSRQEEVLVREKMSQEEELLAKIPDMVIKDEDTVLVDYIKKSVEDWQSPFKERQEPYLNIPAATVPDSVPEMFNRYQIRLTHQVVQHEYPQLKTQSMGHFVQVTNPTPHQQRNEKAMRERQRQVDIAHAVGLRWVMEALMGGDITKLPTSVVAHHFPDEARPSDIPAFLRDLQNKLASRPRALVGHNCFTDLVNLYRCFVGDLPARVGDFGARIHAMFPLILDTKYLAGLGGKRWASTDLISVDRDFRQIGRPANFFPPNFDKYRLGDPFHEAGFDSYLTVRTGLKLIVKLKRDGKNVKDWVKQTLPVAKSASRARASSDVAPVLATPSSGAMTALVEALKAPVAAAVTSILAGSDRGSSKANETVAAANEETTTKTQGHTTSTPSVPVAKQNPRVVPVIQPAAEAKPKALRAWSQKANIFDLLDDDAPDVAADHDVQAARKKRIEQLVRDGDFTPRWKDLDFWNLIGNKLQANGSQEGILDLGPWR